MTQKSLSPHAKEKRQLRLFWLFIFSVAAIIAAMILFFTTPLRNYLPWDEIFGQPETKTEYQANGELPESADREIIYYNPLSGEKMESEAATKRRPLAIMVASDVDTRPQSGLAEAEWVFELPAGRGVMTRLMPVYLAHDPTEVGSLRSSRHDFVELARGLDALYAHWGASYIAYDRYLKKNFVDNLDVMRYPDAEAFYRVTRLYPPHNGFASLKKLREIAVQKGYPKTTNLRSYSFYTEDKLPTERPEKGELYVGQPGSFAVTYKYNGGTNSYARYYGTKPHTDYNTKKTLTVQNVIIMRTTWYLPRQDQQYVEIDLEGEGLADFYQNGKRIQGIWKKATPASELRFYHGPNKDVEVPLVPGHTWIHVVAQNIPVTWKPVVPASTDTPSSDPTTTP